MQCSFADTWYDWNAEETVFDFCVKCYGSEASVFSKHSFARLPEAAELAPTGAVVLAGSGRGHKMSACAESWAPGPGGRFAFVWAAAPRLDLSAGFWPRPSCALRVGSGWSFVRRDRPCVLRGRVV